MDMPLLSYGSVLPQVFVILAVAYGTWKYIEAKTSPVGVLTCSLWYVNSLILMPSQLNSIPVVGYSGILTSYITAFEFLQHGGDLVKEGFDKVCQTVNSLLGHHSLGFAFISIQIRHSEWPIFLDGLSYFLGPNLSMMYVKPQLTSYLLASLFGR